METKIVDRIVEKVVEKVVEVERVVYRDRERANSEFERDVSEHESIEENFEVLGKIKVGESSVSGGTFANLERDD